ncbi:MAG: DUF480 domain-containing protein [Gemmatirosa sp.]|nr:DUF480 domain-containing protein [Gemmatirosa sp.]
MVDPPLTDVEVRVLGSLVEKEVTTPDAYPLSASALTAACSQTSNRDPVMRLDEDAVTIAVVALRRRGLVRAIQPAGSRVTKYEHLLAHGPNLDARELAVLCVLMLRGPQTQGELHARTTRLAEFADPAAIEATLEALIAREPEPLVTRLARRPGQKEMRYAHLLSGPVSFDAGDALGAPAEQPRASRDDDRIAALEQTVSELRAELAALRAELAEFRAQFQ